MNNMIQRLKIKYIVFTIIMLLVCQILSFFRLITPIYGSYILIFLGGIGLILYLFDKIKNKKKIDIYDILIILLSIFGIISTIFAINVKVSLLGFNTRCEGLLAILFYYILFLISRTISNNKYKNIIINFILLYGLLHSIYGILQYFNLKILNIPVINNWHYATGFERNPNFLGSIVIISLSISLGKLFMNSNKKSNIVFTILSIIYFMGLLTSGTMSAVLTFVLINVILIIVIIINKIKIKEVIVKSLIIILSFILCFIIFNNYDHNYLSGQINKTKDEIKNVVQGNIEDKYGTGRIYIWKNTLKKVPDNLLTGVGIDNYYYAFSELRDLKSHKLIDKAHNEYLQKLITEGLFSCITYITLLLIIFIKAIKTIITNKKKNNGILITLFLGFTAYLIQAFFNISVIFVAPLFYIIMGMLLNEVESYYEKN